MAVQLTTNEYWDINGVPLNTYAYNISTLSGRTGTPGLRGEDQEHAYRPGRSFRPKVPDSRTLTLSMWVQGSDPNTVGQVTGDFSAQFHSNLQMLENLFYSPREQFVLTKRWFDKDGLHTASALGQVISPVLPSHTRGRALLTVDVFLADPFFYDVSPTVVDVALGVSAVSVNPGVDSTPKFLTVTFTGPLTKPVLRNTTPSPDIVLKFNDTIAAGQSVVVDVDSSRATRSGVGVNPLVSYTGSVFPMEVLPGSNNFNLSADSGSGSAQVSYRPARF